MALGLSLELSLELSIVLGPDWLTQVFQLFQMLWVVTDRLTGQF